MRLFSIVAVVFCLSIRGWAQTSLESQDVATSAQSSTGAPPDGGVPQTGNQHPAAKINGPGFETRAKIHKYASIATLPLFATELWLGQALYNDSSGNIESKKGAHIAVGTGIIGLFGVNSVTGAWNMWESRKDPDGRALRLLHGSLMIASNVGFVATAATGPGGHNRSVPLTFAADRSTHRNIAITSMSIGTVGYLIMLIGGRR